MDISRTPQEKTKSKEWNKQDLYDALNTEIEYYTSQMSSQAERLIGFAIILFTIVQAIQYSRQNSLSTIFPDVSGWFQSQWLSSNIVFQSLARVHALELFQFFFLFAIIVVLLVFIFRTIFRYTIFGYSLAYARLVTLEDTISSDGSTLFDAIRLCTLDKLRKAKRKSFLFPSEWFFEAEDSAKGWAVCFCAALFCTVGIILVW